MEENIANALERAARNISEGSRTLKYISIESQRELASRFKFSNREMSVHALENGFVPSRYLKNIGTIGLDGQARLLRSKVLIAGVGGIGGNAAELLSRMGVGSLTLADPDVFEESNLNRQNFSTDDSIGLPKVEVAANRLALINRDVEVTCHQLTTNPENLPGLLEGASVAIDALDNFDDRLVLQECCRQQKVVMIHGAIAGNYLQATTVFPSDPGLGGYIPRNVTGEKTKGIEVETGNPATTPSLVASIQAQEAINIILGRKAALRHRMLYLDLDDWTVEFIEL